MNPGLRLENKAKFNCAMRSAARVLRAYSCFMEIFHYSNCCTRENDEADYNLSRPHAGLHAAAAAGLLSVAGWLIAEGAEVSAADIIGYRASTSTQLISQGRLP